MDLSKPPQNVCVPQCLCLEALQTLLFRTLLVKNLYLVMIGFITGY